MGTWKVRTMMTGLTMDNEIKHDYNLRKTFRFGRGTVDMIFSLRQLQEKCKGQQKPLHVAFVDFTKALDLVKRSALFQILQKVGCPPVFLISAFRVNM